LTHVPGFAIHAIDTTGAGDVFRAAFIWALLNGLETRDMLKFANAAAAAACLREGAMASVPALDEVQRVLSGA
jgi:sugar/nucleoside kinase (ribokinase family)